MQTDNYAITYGVNDAKLRAAADILGVGALDLLTTEVGPYGSGYKLAFTSAGLDAGITFTVVGYEVGNTSGNTRTEVVTGADIGVATTTRYYSRIVSITASGASADTVAVGTTGSIALPRLRIKGVYYVGAASAGSIVVTAGDGSGKEVLNVPTPAAATVAESITVPGNGIVSTASISDEYALVTLTEVANVVFFCG